MNITFRLSDKFRLVACAADPFTSLFLTKLSWSYWLSRIGIVSKWTQEIRSLRLRIADKTVPFLCEDHKDHVQVLKEVLVDKHYTPQFEIGDVHTVVDLGANIGAFSTYAWHVFGNPNIVCVEPDTTNHHLLRQNMGICGNKCKIIQSAIVGAEREGMIAFDSSRASLSRKVYSSEATLDIVASAERVRAISLDRLLAETGINEVDLLKCDIEGEEADVFEQWSGSAIIKHIVLESHSVLLTKRVKACLMNRFDLLSDLDIGGGQCILWFKLKQKEASDT